MENEIWVDIKGFEKQYQVSSIGRIRSLDRHITGKDDRTKLLKGRILKLRTHSGGYLQVALGRNSNNRYVHRLVAEAFIPNPLGKEEVNHKNGIKTDNLIENLEWATRSENQIHCKSTGLSPTGESHPQAKLTNEQVRFIKDNYKPFDPIFGAKPLSEKFNVARSMVSRIANGTKRVHR